MEGSGFTCHQDPHGTCAWNALIYGRKRWACLPPSTPLCQVFPGWEGAAGNDLPARYATAAAWFANALPQLQAAAVPGLAVFEQEEGEVVLLPANHWHCCITTSPVSIGITHNFMSREGCARELAKLPAQSPLASAWRERVAGAGLPL